MKQFITVTLVLFGLTLWLPGYATVQVGSSADNPTTASGKELNKKEFRDFIRSKKAEIKLQSKAERFWKASPDRVSEADGSTDQIVAMVLCFFLGALGLHRLYLESKPIIILWYFISFGGLFGLIPLIDLIRLIMGQTDHYRGNSNLFRAFQ